MATPKVSVPELDLRTMQITLVGDTPLIMHKFSEKAKNDILEKQQRRAKRGREVRDPDAEYKASLYDIPDQPGAYGFPVMGFKKAAVRAAKSVPDIAMTDARGFFHILADPSHMLIPLKYKELVPIEDVVRIGQGTADLRYRGYFHEWECDLTIQFNAGVVSPEQIILLFDIAGFSVGVGDWRPERDGQYGRFHVKKGGE